MTVAVGLQMCVMNSGNVCVLLRLTLRLVTAGQVLYQLSYITRFFFLLAFFSTGNEAWSSSNPRGK